MAEQLVGAVDQVDLHRSERYHFAALVYKGASAPAGVAAGQSLGTRQARRPREAQEINPGTSLAAYVVPGCPYK
jgi:hypothetical protein